MKKKTVKLMSVSGILNQGLKFKRSMKLEEKKCMTSFLLISNRRRAISIMNRQQTILVMVVWKNLQDNYKIYKEILIQK